jgi:predicted adenine nucleotide alpha hydrolase (AANH) superfamily ATPase
MKRKASTQPATSPANAKGRAGCKKKRLEMQGSFHTLPVGAVPSKDVEEWNEQVLAMRKPKNMGSRKKLAYLPEFKALQSMLSKHGYKACSSLVCQSPVKQMESGFCKHRGMADGHNTKCNMCDHDPDVAAAAKQQKRRAREVTDATVGKMSQIDTETEAINNCLAPLHEAAGMKHLINYEFRKADTMARRESWMAPPNLYLPEQVKSEGVYRCDGVTRKPNNSSRTMDGGGRAVFSDCMGYESMVMIFVKSRFVDATSDEIVRKIWVVDGALMTKDTLHENIDGTLGPQRFVPLSTCSAAEFGVSIDALVTELKKPLVPLETLLRDVEAPLQRKEMLLMLACKAVFTVEFKPGNQTSVDCLLNGNKTQVKSHNLKAGVAHTSHFVNGVKEQPYSEHEDIAQLLIGCVVKSGDKFYLMYALLSRHTLMLNNVFKHSGYRGRPPSSGTTNVHLIGGIYADWLTKHKNKINKNTAWLQAPKNQWRTPVELIPGDPAHGLSLEELEEVAQKAHNPTAFPGKVP